MAPKIPVDEPLCLRVAVENHAIRHDTVNGYFTYIPNGNELWTPHIEGRNGYTDGICFDLLNFARKNGFKSIVYTSYRKRGAEFFARFVDESNHATIGTINKVTV